MSFSSSSKSWAQEFQRKHGRKPRVLHVGNIANNAYLNARILNEHGIENHIAANDLYHFGSCPEWYDSGPYKLDRSKLGHDFFPNFWAAGLESEVRPRWFAQAPQFMTICYLKMLCDGHPLTELAWNALEYERFKTTICKNTMPERLALSDEEFAKYASESGLSQETIDNFNGVRAFRPLVDAFIELVVSLQGEHLRELIGLPLSRKYVDAFRDYAPEEFWMEWDSARECGALAAVGYELDEFERAGVYVQPKGTIKAECDLFSVILPAWDDLFSRYDNIILYATQPILGMLSRRNYLSYEHGTIRAIPFDDFAIGRLTNRSYMESAGVFVTNIDYVTAEQRLEFKDSQLYYIPHGFDERPLLKFLNDHKDEFKPPEDVVTFFWPTRQDWKSRDWRMAKQNDVVIKAAARVKKATDKPFKVIAVEWGVDLEDSKKLIERLGLEDVFEWIRPANKQRLWQYYMESHCVIDQFIGSSVNGITSEAMMMARPVMCYDDGICAKVAYGESPPYLSGMKPKELRDCFLTIIEDPNDQAGYGQRSLDWMLKHHTIPVIVNIFEKALKRCPNKRKFMGIRPATKFTLQGGAILATFAAWKLLELPFKAAAKLMRKSESEKIVAKKKADQDKLNETFAPISTKFEFSKWRSDSGIYFEKILEANFGPEAAAMSESLLKQQDLNSDNLLGVDPASDKIQKAINQGKEEFKAGLNRAHLDFHQKRANVSQKYDAAKWRLNQNAIRMRNNIKQSREKLKLEVENANSRLRDNAIKLRNSAQHSKEVISLEAQNVGWQTKDKASDIRNNLKRQRELLKLKAADASWHLKGNAEHLRNNIVRSKEILKLEAHNASWHIKDKATEIRNNIKHQQELLKLKASDASWHLQNNVEHLRSNVLNSKEVLKIEAHNASWRLKNKAVEVSNSLKHRQALLKLEASNALWHFKNNTNIAASNIKYFALLVRIETSNALWHLKNAGNIAVATIKYSLVVLKLNISNLRWNIKNQLAILGQNIHRDIIVARYNIMLFFIKHRNRIVTDFRNSIASFMVHIRNFNYHLDHLTSNMTTHNHNLWQGIKDRGGLVKYSKGYINRRIFKK